MYHSTAGQNRIFFPVRNERCILQTSVTHKTKEGISMKTALVPIIFLVCLSSISAFAADAPISGQSYACPRSVAVEVTIKTDSPVSGWETIPAKSTFTLAIKENAVQRDAMICHYSDGTVDYNIAKASPKGKTCHIAPNQSFMCDK
jgi:hypothetical protein